MKEFFLDLLNRLDSLTGFKQLDKINASANSKQQLEQLIKTLIDTAKEFSFIPDEHKKKILYKAVVSDKEFIGLNARFIYKHLALNADRFFVQDHHRQDDKQQPEPLTGEAREQKIKEFLEVLKNVDNNFIFSKEKSRRETLLPGGDQPTPKHRSTTAEEHAERLLHNQWIRENFDMYQLGKKLPGYQDEETWRKNRIQK